jgi:hypothetical protein
MVGMVSATLRSAVVGAMGRGGPMSATFRGGAGGSGAMRGAGDGSEEERGEEAVGGEEKSLARAWSWADLVKALVESVEPGEGLRMACRISRKPV